VLELDAALRDERRTCRAAMTQAPESVHHHHRATPGQHAVVPKRAVLVGKTQSYMSTPRHEHTTRSTA
jgi:thymidine kinase